MEISGYPLYVFAPVAMSMALSFVLVWQLSVLTKALGIDVKTAPEKKRLNAALYGGEHKLHDLGVHRTVWTIRLAFIGHTAGILLFAYLLYRVTEGV